MSLYRGIQNVDDMCLTCGLNYFIVHLGNELNLHIFHREMWDGMILVTKKKKEKGELEQHETVKRYACEDKT